jgi:hypothetical protein
MSLIKGKQEFRTILDFSKVKLSKNKIKEALRQAEVLEVIRREDSSNAFVENFINVGMYEVRLIFSSIDAETTRSRLKEYGKFRVAVYERGSFGKSMNNINLSKDKRFKNQYWVDLNKDYNLGINNLVDVIMYLRRLDNLKMFL